MKAQLTEHARQRLAERSTLSEVDLFTIIENRRYVVVGVEPYTNRIHKLFYSEQDNAHFVAIQDNGTAEIITILPLDFHSNLAWKVSAKKLQNAIFLVSPILHDSIFLKEIPPSPGIAVKITLLLHSTGPRAIRKGLGSHRFAKRPVDAEEALGDPEFIETLMRRFRDRQVPICEVEEVHLTDKRNDFVLIIPWETLVNFEDDLGEVEIGCVPQAANCAEAAENSPPSHFSNSWGERLQVGDSSSLNARAPGNISKSPSRMGCSCQDDLQTLRHGTDNFKSKRLGMSVYAIEVPKDLEALGFLSNKSGGHMSRSMMFSEIKHLQTALPEEAGVEEIKAAIIDRNLLGKPTQSSREKSFQHLMSLYGLDHAKPVYRVLRRLGKASPGDLPLLAMLCVFVRDPQFRHSFALVDTLQPGTVLSREEMEQHLEAGFPGRFSPAMKRSLSQNVNTSWTVSGHLSGGTKKVRSLPRAGWAATTYAMFLGYLLGLRGEMLLGSVFGKLVAAQMPQAVAHLTTAASRHWLRLRHGGGVIEIDFSELAKRS